jgi:GAF domain-containing protein
MKTEQTLRRGSGEIVGGTAMQQGGTTRNPQTSVSAALAAANAGARGELGSPMRFPGEDGGKSLAEMAHRDLDAALQLLADRAQYITGANGAAIALRRDGKNDMLCRASTGTNAPELGALLSTEFGLSGESVRTRQALRCDDAERDVRVNREVCHQLGIASVVVMPVVNDDEVLGVFELFSGKAHAFGERDLSALQRLSEMVETAVKLARAAESLPQVTETAAGGKEVMASEVDDEEILEVEGAVAEVKAAAVAPPVERPAVAVPAAAAAATATTAAKAVPHTAVPTAAQIVSEAAAPILSENTSKAAPQPAPATPAGPKKPLFWSAALDVNAEAERAAEPDQSHVPPMLRNLKKCEACGFPVSAGRVLCVECEEKKWRGQLRMPKLAAPQKGSSSATAEPVSAPVSAPVARLVAAAQSGTAAAAAPVLDKKNAPVAAVSNVAAPVKAAEARRESKDLATQPASAPGAVSPSVPALATAPAVEWAEAAPPDFVLSAGLEPSQSWFSRNKYIFGAIVLIAATVAGILWLR